MKRTLFEKIYEEFVVQRIFLHKNTLFSKSGQKTRIKKDRTNGLITPDFFAKSDRCAGAFTRQCYRELVIANDALYFSV